ncbi:hypothetical protein DFS34DRAFT_326774 [Phlyctochytrium arcticum]|nr:hypothetical protein DFS34DRAFT_326774 [Phlyctochytrium arcticum]
MRDENLLGVVGVGLAGTIVLSVSESGNIVVFVASVTASQVAAGGCTESLSKTGSKSSILVGLERVVLHAKDFRGGETVLGGNTLLGKTGLGELGEESVADGSVVDVGNIGVGELALGVVVEDDGVLLAFKDSVGTLGGSSIERRLSSLVLLDGGGFGLLDSVLDLASEVVSLGNDVGGLSVLQETTVTSVGLKFDTGLELGTDGIGLLTTVTRVGRVDVGGVEGVGVEQGGVELDRGLLTRAEAGTLGSGNLKVGADRVGTGLNRVPVQLHEATSSGATDVGEVGGDSEVGTVLGVTSTTGEARDGSNLGGSGLHVGPDVDLALSVVGVVELKWDLDGLTGGDRHERGGGNTVSSAGCHVESSFLGSVTLVGLVVNVGSKEVVVVVLLLGDELGDTEGGWDLVGKDVGILATGKTLERTVTTGSQSGVLLELSVGETVALLGSNAHISGGGANGTEQDDGLNNRLLGWHVVGCCCGGGRG